MIDLISRSIAALQFKHCRFQIQGSFSIDYNERRSHARGVYLTQETSMKQEEGADTGIIVKE